MDPGERVTVATFNIHHGAGRDDRIDLERTAHVIRSLGADLVALQEVDRNLSRSDHVDQVARLQELTGYKIAFHPALLREQGEYGLAIATKDEIATTAESLPRRGAEERRIAIEARWRGLSVITTHLSRDPAARTTQTEALASMADRLPPPAIVLGDLNEPRRNLGPLMASGYRPRQIRGLWWWRSTISRGIDHVLAGPGLEVVRSRVVRTVASDHHALVAQIRRGK